MEDRKMPSRDETEDYAEALDALSQPERIDMLSYLKQEGETTLEELSDYMESIGYEDASVPLIHQHLPLLEDYGVIESRDNTIKYRGDEVIEEIIETLEGV
jgi:DNA-binding transcriptional ArsR family regulator